MYIKRILALILALVVQQYTYCCAADVEIVRSYYLLKYEYQDFVTPLLYAGATEKEIVEFFKDVEAYLANIEDINRENFEGHFKRALLGVSGEREHVNLSATIFQCYGDDIEEYTETNVIPEKFQSVYEALLEVLFGNGFDNKAELAVNYENCKKIYDTGLSEYTDTTVAALKSALDEALEVLKNTDASAEEIASAQENLNTAYNGLKKKPTGGNGNSNTGNGSGTGGGGTGGGSGTGSAGTGSAVGSGVQSGSTEGIGANQGIITPSEEIFFKDLTKEHWSYPAVQYLAQRKVINGFEDNTFRPEQLVTREEFAKMVCAAFELKNTGANISYADANPKEWYNEYIQAITANGIMKGIGNNKFGLGATLTRQDLAVISYRLITNGMVIKTYNEESQYTPFEDLIYADDYAVDAIMSMQKMGVINGVGNNLYAPLDGVTRAQAAQIIYSLLSK